MTTHIKNLQKIYKLTTERSDSGKTLLSTTSLNKSEIRRLIEIIIYNEIRSEQFEIHYRENLKKQLNENIDNADYLIEQQGQNHLKDYRDNQYQLLIQICRYTHKQGKKWYRKELVWLLENLKNHLSPELTETIKWFGI